MLHGLLFNLMHSFRGLASIIPPWGSGYDKPSDVPP